MIKKVSCIIPAFNEEKTIAGVIKTCLETPEIDEVIVVSDGSEDKTVAEVKKIKGKIKIIDLKQNHGKGYAVVQGIKEAKNELLLFMDADFVNLQPYHLSSIINPVLSDQVDMAIGPNFALEKPFLQRTLLTTPFCGQRCLKKKDVLPVLKKMEKSKYGLEVFLNNLFKKKRVIVTPIISNKELHLLKHKKQNNWLPKYIQEVWEIVQLTAKNKSKEYRKKIKKELSRELSSYFQVSIKKIKEYLNED
ncbi:MAG: glycosyltransferase family 2 protein [Patescibacteria group bacterium]|nr:glycosyltransferase family 2 protein [Patescibacteria group bacterium]